MIRILLAHPSRLICDSLRTALAKEENVYVVGCTTTAEGLRFLLPHGNLVLLATELEDATAFEVLEDIQRTQSEVKVLVIGVDDRPETVVRYVEAGAVGYVLQHESVEDVIGKLQAAHEHKALVSPSVAAALIERLAHLASLEMPLASLEARQGQISELTSREQEVLSLIHDGYTNREIADELVIQCGTVKNHVHSILKKLEVSSRHEAASVYQMYNRPAPAGLAA